MRRDYFEDYYKSIGYKTTKLFSNGFDISKIGFLYSDDENAFNKVVLFYTPEKEDLIEYVEQILETARKSEVDFTVLGYIKKGTNKYLITVNRKDVYYIDADLKAKLVNDIQPEFMICPEIIFYTYRMKVDIIKVSF